VPLFHTQHCIVSGAQSSDQCSRPCRLHRAELEDRNGERHAILSDALCRNTVHNSYAQSALQMLASMRQAGLRNFRIDLLRETPQEAQSLVELYSRALSGEDGSNLWSELKEREPLTRGTWATE
jgi:putative protease